MKVSNTASKRKISLHSHLPIPIQVASCSKGQLISETIFLCLNSSKKQKQYLKFFALATRAEVFRYFFGRIKIKIICFWNYLTFSCPTAQAWPNFLGLAASTVVPWCYPGCGVSNKIRKIKVRKYCHFLDHPPTPMSLHNIKMAPKDCETKNFQLAFNEYFYIKQHYPDKMHSA